MSSNEVFLSVIIPVYNVEKYLNQCVDSVLGQHLNNYEIILVDDGSPDRCPEICDEYAAKYNEIRVIHQENGGLSAARNAGLQAAVGEYVIFMDSDDWWNPDVCVAEMLAQVKADQTVDMFLFTSYDYVEGEGFYKRNEHGNLHRIQTDTVEHYYRDLLGNGNLEVSACTKILRRNFLIDHSLFFAKGLLGEDNHWMIRVLRSLQKVRVIDQPLYLCRMSRQGSISNTIKKKNISDMLRIVNESIDYCGAKDEKTEREKYELCFCSYLWFSALGLSGRLSKEDNESLFNMFTETSWVCKYSSSRKTNLAYLLYRMVGITITRHILSLYIRCKNSLILNKRKTSAT